MEEAPSARIIDQRIRNRIIDAVHILALGDAGVRTAGTVHYFENFYDFVPHHCEGEMLPNSAITFEELQSLSKVSALVDDACDATPSNLTVDGLIATGWPKRIQFVALQALEHMLVRGRFHEEKEEVEPGVNVFTR